MLMVNQLSGFGAKRRIVEIDIIWDRHTANWTLSNGDTTAAFTGFNDFVQAGTTNAAMSSGKWYWEVLHESSQVTQVGQVGISRLSPTSSGELGNDADDYAYSANNGSLRNNNSDSAYGNAYNDGHIIGVALDMDNGILWFSKNGTWQAGATISEIEAGTGTNAAATGLGGTYYVAAGQLSGSSRTTTLTVRTKAADLTHTVPSGFKPLAQQ